MGKESKKKEREKTLNNSNIVNARNWQQNSKECCVYRFFFIPYIMYPIELAHCLARKQSEKENRYRVKFGKKKSINTKARI